MVRWFAISLFLASLVSSARGAEPIRVDVSRDAWISAYPSEQEGNNGGAPRLKLKGIQEFFLVDFDATPYRGKVVERAELWIRSEGSDVADRITVSTVTSPWKEGGGSNYDREADGCSFVAPHRDARGWGKGLQDVTSVSLGQGGSLWSFGDASKPDRDGWQRIPIAPQVIQARLEGSCEGFLVMDDLGSEYRRDGNRFEYRLMPGRFFASREKNRSSSPFFKLWLRDSPAGRSDLVEQTAVDEEPLATPISHPQQDLLRNLVPVDRSKDQSKSNSVLKRLDGTPEDPTPIGVSRGEALAWLLDCRPEDVSISPNPNFEISLFALPPIAGRSDPAVPIDRWKQGDVPLRNQDPASVKTCIEIYVRKTASAGLDSVQLRIADRRVDLAFKVWDLTLPDQLSFIPQMNCYGLPEKELDYYRLCHDHRTTLNCLRYAWTGKVADGAAPKIRSDGTWDWSAWDQRFAPLFDGSAFAKSRRGPIPIEAFYLPLNENWPMDHESHFQGGYWIEHAYRPAYWNAFRDAVRRFRDHFDERRFQDTVFEFYLNNKVYFKQERGGRWDACSAPWIFDEPVNTQDFWALRRFGIEFWDAIGKRSIPKFAFRLDISRPQWQRDLLDGISNVEVVSGTLRTYQTRIMRRAERFQNWVYMYGAANDFNQPIANNIHWCVETWLRGGVGIVPWQTMGTEQSWSQLDPLSVVYPTPSGPVASLRLKSFRHGQQLVEYLAAFGAETNLSREAMRSILFSSLGIEGETILKHENDAGSVRYAVESMERLERLRDQLGDWLHHNAKVRTWNAQQPPLRHGASQRTTIEPVLLVD